MKALWLVLILAVPNLMALEVTTLDGKTYRDCEVSKVFPDSICVLFPGGGARIKFTNLPEATRAKYGYDVQRSAAFEQAEAAREEREQAILAAQRAQSAAKRLQIAAARQAAASNTNEPAATTQAAVLSPRSTLAGGYGGGNATGLQGAYNGQFGNQFGGRGAGASYVGVRMVWPGGGVRGIVAAPTTPPGNVARTLGLTP